MESVPYVVIALVIAVAIIKVLGVLNWNPWFYWIGGPLLSAAFAASYFTITEDNDERRRALLEGPPAPVSIASFDPERHIGLARETALAGDLRTDLEVRFDRKIAFGLELPAWAAPILPKGDARDAPVKAVVYVGNVSKDSSFDQWRATSELGADHAPIRGLVRRSTDKRVRELVAAALAERGLKLSDEAVLIEPFLEERAEALQPESILNSVVLPALFGIVIFGYGFVRRWLKRRDISFG